MVYLNGYISVSDSDPANNYRKADLLYLSKKYPEAIREADVLVSAPAVSVDPRLYKLQAYSYYEMGDSAKALIKCANILKSNPILCSFRKILNQCQICTVIFPAKTTVLLFI